MSLCLKDAQKSRVNFGHVTRLNGESISFTNRNWIEQTKWFVPPVNTCSFPPFYSKPENIKWLPPFCYMDFSVSTLNTCYSCIAKEMNWVPKRYCIPLNILFYWLVLFPTKYSVLGYSLWTTKCVIRNKMLSTNQLLVKSYTDIKKDRKVS